MTDGWYRNARGNWCKRWTTPTAPPKRGAFPCPMIASDTLETPLYSGADGKLYDSKSKLRATYLPSGNPDGILYNEIGNEQIPIDPPTPDTAGIDASIQKAIARLNA